MNETQSIAVGRAVPVTVLTGLLGAGRTTLLNRILNGDYGLRIVVLVKDFGSISFVWTGGGRSDDLSAELAEGVDVFVTEDRRDISLL